ncbi:MULTISPECIES: sensor histidine kinase [unclassified Streptomyces]|uniref:sensor histidine kinase n=1 Tax=unclassified Streptomyces TaxID=2593676 RepID=UPI00081F67BF|nr:MULTISPECIES: sensor histidine kinase [unclassified Streptomyces]MYZ38033.1 PAS domain-containing protein [Streptomyces sp. SID4917]SCF95844.1 Sensor histidine kinase regulating citrate/malate metabolism [Streptomyces sp. MnatMP-M17]
MHLPRPRSLATQLFAMQVVLVAAVVAGCALFAYITGRAHADETARKQVLATAYALADSPSVREAIRTPDPTALLQPYAERVRHDTGIDFITIMNPDGIRWTHPDPAQIGMPFLGRTAPALRGETFTETYTGTLGPSIRAVTPVRDNGRITGLVSVGITVDRISSEVTRQVKVLAWVAGAALVLGGLGTYVINARLRRHTHGMNAAELSRMHDYHQAALHAVREGLLMLDGRRRIALMNDAGRELLGLDDSAVGRPVAELGLPAPLTDALLASGPRVDEVHMTADRIVVVNTQPVVGGERRGTVITLRDHTELQALSGELDSERGFTQALRSQAHEAANRLHTVVSLIELGRVEQAVEFATAELELAQALTDRVVGAVGEPVLAALLLGKAAQANERGVELVLAEDSRIDDGVLPTALAPRDLVTILGNLIDNAVDAAQGGEGARVTVTALVNGGDGGDSADGEDSTDGGELLLGVRDTGDGVDPEDMEEVFRRGWSTRGPGRGLGLALVRQAVHRAQGTVELARGAEGGAEFTVRLPLGRRPSGPGGAGVVSSPTSAGTVPSPGDAGTGAVPSSADAEATPPAVPSPRTDPTSPADAEAAR